MTKTERETADLIIGRLQQLFKPQSKRQYKLVVVNDMYDDGFNFFFDTKHSIKSERSVSLATIEGRDLEFLEKTIRLVKKETNLSIEYVEFDGERWPISQRAIR